MKTIMATAFAAFIFTSASAHAALDILHLSIGGEINPGIYGQLHLGHASAPAYYPQHRVIVRQPATVILEPIYLNTYNDYNKYLPKNCRKYNSCKQAVYHIRSSGYEPGYRSQGYRKHSHRERHGEQRYRGGRHD